MVSEKNSKCGAKGLSHPACPCHSPHLHPPPPTEVTREPVPLSRRQAWSSYVKVRSSQEEDDGQETERDPT